MSILKNSLSIFLFSTVLPLTALAQQQREIGLNQNVPTESADRLRQMREWEDRGIKPKTNRNRQSAPLPSENRGKYKPLLAPNPADAEKYKDFLKTPNTGLFRLFPNFDCEDTGVIRVGGDCENFIPLSGTYSFRRKDYSSPFLADLKFENGNLIAAGFLSQELLVKLGDVPLEAVSPAGDGVKFLLDFTPATQISEAKKQYLQIAKGIKTANYIYAKGARAALDTTYALRVIAYHSNISGIKTSRTQTDDELRHHFLNKSDKRLDLTIAFRIIRQDEKGSVTILWKELNRQESPKLMFEKGETSLNIAPGN